jgi:hypothetical protein
MATVRTQYSDPEVEARKNNLTGQGVNTPPRRDPNSLGVQDAVNTMDEGIRQGVDAMRGGLENKAAQVVNFVRDIPAAGERARAQMGLGQQATDANAAASNLALDAVPLRPQPAIDPVVAGQPTPSAVGGPPAFATNIAPQLTRTPMERLDAQAILANKHLVGPTGELAPNPQLSPQQPAQQQVAAVNPQQPVVSPQGRGPVNAGVRGTSIDELQAMGNLTGTTRGNGYSFTGTAGDAARFMAPVSRPAATAQSAGPYTVTSGSDFARKEAAGPPVMLGTDSGLGWKTRLAKYREDMESYRNTNSNAAALQREGMSQTGQTDRQKSAEAAHLNLQGQRIGADFGLQDQRLGSEQALQTQRIGATRDLANISHKNDLEKLNEADKLKASEQSRLLGAQALLAGGNEDVASNLVNNAPGTRGDVRGLNIPLKNTQMDNYQFLTQDNGPGKGQSIVVGNKGSGATAVASPESNFAASALVGDKGGAAVKRTQGQQAAAEKAAMPAPVKTPAEGNTAIGQEFDRIYKMYPNRLNEDALAAHGSLGVIHKTDQEQFNYLNSLRTSNPTLYRAVRGRIDAEQQGAR